MSACGGSGDEPPPADAGATRSAAPAATPVQEGGYRALDVADGGNIAGTVYFTGSVPVADVVEVGEGRDVCGATRVIRPVQVDADRRLAHAVVSLIDITQGKSPSATSSIPTLDQRGCEFVPHVVVVPAGTSVRVLNSDPVTHNVHTSSFENRAVNRTQPAGIPPIDLGFAAAERVRVRCDLHPWMSAWVIVTAHPYYAITGSTGTFVLSDVPAGTYTMEIWHEALGARTETVTVVAGDTTAVRIELSMPG